MVDQVSNLGSSLPEGVVTFTLDDETALDPNAVNPYATAYTLPRPSRLTKSHKIASQESKKRPLETGASGVSESQEGDTVLDAANKGGSESEPTVVPLEPKKKRAKRTKTTVSHPIVSQKAAEVQREENTSLDVPSQ